jgi:hypothetical protein
MNIKFHLENSAFHALELALDSLRFCPTNENTSPPIASMLLFICRTNTKNKIKNTIPEAYASKIVLSVHRQGLEPWTP